MNKNGLKNILVLVFMLGIVIVLFPKMIKTSAASETSTTPAKPKITLALSEDGATAMLTIKKTKRAEGYQIVAKLPGSKKYTEIAILELDGKKTRKYTIENVMSGKYTVKVRGYSVQNGKTVYGKYSKAKSVTIENNTPTDLGIEKGDIIQFGTFEQDGDFENGAEPIDWIVLSKEDGKLFLTSEYVLAPGNINWGPEPLEYNDNDPNDDFYKSWENSGLREWLNNEFLSNSFSKKEQAVIADTELKDKDCVDKIFLLSKDDVKNEDYGFIDNAHRACVPTYKALWYTKLRQDEDGKDEYDGVWTWDEGNLYKVNNYEACFWWTRTSADSDSEFYIVSDRGTFTTSYGHGLDVYTSHSDDEEDYYIENGGIGIRPALVINVTAEVKNLITKTGKSMQDEWSTACWVDSYYDDDEDEDGNEDEEGTVLDIPNPQVVDISKAQKGDAVILGSYEQDGDTDNGKEPIEWIVLSRTDDELFVLSKYALAYEPYNISQEAISWEDCSLRKWLNNDFFKEAFTKKEAKKIKTVTLENSLVNTNKQKVSKKKQNATKDKIFLLSFADVLNPEYGFISEDGYNGLRACIASKNVEVNSKQTIATYSGDETIRWWLRSLDVDYQIFAFAVNWFGEFGSGIENYYDIDEYQGIRPAMVISL